MKSKMYGYGRVVTAFIAAFVLYVGLTDASHATPIYSNISASQDGSDPLYASGPLADSFSTDSRGGPLASVQLLLANLSTAFSGVLQVSLLADDASSPGATLASLGSLPFASISTSQFMAYSFAPLSTLLLAPNSRYWIELASSSPNAIQWSWSNDLSGPGVAGQYSYSAAFGVNLNSAGFGPYQLAVSVPEPGSLALLGLAIGMMELREGRTGRKQRRHGLTPI